MLLWELFTSSSRHYPETLQPHLPGPLTDIFIKAVAEKQTIRYQGVNEMMSEFSQAVTTLVNDVGQSA